MGTLRKYEGDGVVFSYYEPIPAFTTPLVENSSGTPTKLDKVNIRGKMNTFGTNVPFTDDLDIYGEDGARFRADVSQNLGGAAGETQEKILLNGIQGNHTPISFNTDVATTLKTAELALRNALGKKFTEMITGSVNYGTTPIRPAYVGFVSPESALEFEDVLSGWKTVADYGYTDGLLPQEVGSYRGIRFCESTLVDTYDTGAGAKAVAYILAEEAVMEVGIRGMKNIETIIKELGSAGTNDALNRSGSIGTKFKLAVATRSEHVVIAELEA
jgi:N4-gp56 family major capsid protein